MKKREELILPNGKIYNMIVAKKNILDLKHIFDKEGFIFWLMFGTLLGVVRDGDLIPYDNDVDIAMYAGDALRLQSIKEEIKSIGFEIGIAGLICTFLRDMVPVDCYFFHLENGERRWMEHKYPSFIFETEEYIEWMGEKWRIPSRPEDVLTYIYGDWEIPQKNKSAIGQPRGKRNF